MINFNNKTEKITLFAIDEKNVPEFVDKTDKQTTFLNKESKIYMVLSSVNKNKFKQLKSALTNFVKNNKISINIDMDSFFTVLKELKKEIIFNTIFETVDFNTFEGYSLKSKKNKTDVIYNLIIKNDIEQFEKLFEKEKIKTEFTNFARKLQDTPPNIGTSVFLAKTILEEAKKYPNIKAKVIGKTEAEKLGMGLFLGVNSGSFYECQAVVLEYVSDSNLKCTGLVGKGITFDSGGYNLKPSQFMEGMKFDMSGAAIVLSSILALAKANAKANVVGIGLFTDNRIGATATLPESVLTSMNGQTVEINNTDAEGRLVLADGITFVIREANAERVIEASTLTGAIGIALGPWFTGAFTTNDELFNEFKKSADYTGENIWRLPIIAEHLEAMQSSSVADLTNSEKGRNAGSSTAAAFLNSFAEEKPYLHLDIAATADNGKSGTGVMVKTIFELLNK